MYDHRKIEPEVLEALAKDRVYEKADAKNKKGDRTYFCDGPPYATGHIHPGTAWNKCMKDCMCRYYRSRGHHVLARPGFDTHGLPIEVKVEQELGISNKKGIEEIGVDKFIVKCKGFADRYVKVMTGQFQRLGIWMDWDNPYITYKNEYIESSWKTFAIAHEKGLLYEGVHVLPYCYRCETTMANYELEYGEEADPSAYVKFKVKGKKDTFLIIWTTTPWTLVANMAVMVHPMFAYVKAKVGDETWIIAKDRLEHVLAAAGKTSSGSEEISGKKLDGMEYEHPFQERIKKTAERAVILSDEFVTLEDGSGLVHCAPGNGQEDFIVGKRHNLEVFSPVDGTGAYTAEAGEYAGQNVKDANYKILKMLEESGMLVHSERIKHRYPHCWRCKTPLIFRATDQWFIAVSKIKEKMLAEIETADWRPEFAKSRFLDFVGQAPDWCISRQRFWGIPLPIWKCAACGKIKVIGSSSELPEKFRKMKDLHRPEIDAPEFECECKGKMRRVKDVLDVWFDSGNAVWAGKEAKRGAEFNDVQADFIIEGQDQIRGWFYSLLGLGVVRNERIPYKKLMMHGFFVDDKGEKMSKSVGNFIPIEEIVEKHGADSFRLWGASNALWEEIKFNWDALKEAHSDIDTFVNMCTFLARFYSARPKAAPQLGVEDKWLLSRANSTLKAYHAAFEAGEPYLGVKAMRRFIVEDLSRFYMKLAKDRIARDDNAEGALHSVYYATLFSLQMLSNICPLVSERMYQDFFRKYEGAESAFLMDLPTAHESDINTALEGRMEMARGIIAKALEARQRTGIKLRWPAREAMVVSSSGEITDMVNELSGVFKRLLNCKGVSAGAQAPTWENEKAEFEGGVVYVNKVLDEELYREGIYNDVKRRVQSLRKETALLESDRIGILIFAPKDIEGIISTYSGRLAGEAGADDIKFGAAPNGKEFNIDGKVVVIEIVKKGAKHAE
jgi:isoleucyl-tRNA synthetase